MEKMQKQAYRISEFCACYGVGRSKAYQEIASGRLAIAKIGRITLIPREAAQRWLEHWRGQEVGQ